MGEAVEHGHYLIDIQTVFQVFEYGCHRNACAAKYPSSTYFSGNALKRITL